MLLFARNKLNNSSERHPKRHPAGANQTLNEHNLVDVWPISGTSSDS
jgi:hypothetical protein